MTIQRIVIQNFQSLKKVDVELGRFTVIVGASSSGKSAFMRAVKALASNVRGSSMITVGEKSMSIMAHTDENIVTLQRTGATGKYVILNKNSGQEEKYTKLAQKVPEDVTAALKIQPVSKDQTSINFSGQHDLPYLLGDNVSAAQVARILGDLTNVSTIFEAVREANKKKAAANSLINTRDSDFQEILSQVEDFAGLKDRISLVQSAETALDEISSLGGTLQLLELTVAAQRQSEALLQGYQELPGIPSLDSLEKSYEQYSQVRKHLSIWLAGQEDLKNLSVMLENAVNIEAEAHKQFHIKLSELGTCPTCGQEL
jgi:DNA repair exonuclease SbcCD ATPase subunit